MVPSMVNSFPLGVVNGLTLGDVAPPGLVTLLGKAVNVMVLMFRHTLVA